MFLDPKNHTIQTPNHLSLGMTGRRGYWRISFRFHFNFRRLKTLYTHNAFRIPPEFLYGKNHHPESCDARFPSQSQYLLEIRRFTYLGPPKPIFFEVFMVNNRWPKPSCFMVLGAHGRFASNWCLEKNTSPNAGETHGEIDPMGTKNFATNPPEKQIQVICPDFPDNKRLSLLNHHLG